MPKEKSTQWLRNIAAAPLEQVPKMTDDVFEADRLGALRKHILATMYAVQFKKIGKPIPEYLRAVLNTLGDRLF